MNYCVIKGRVSFKNSRISKLHKLILLMMITRSDGSIPCLFKNQVFDKIMTILDNNRSYDLDLIVIGKITNKGTFKQRKVMVEVDDFSVPYKAPKDTYKVNMDEYDQVVEDEETI